MAENPEIQIIAEPNVPPGGHGASWVELGLLAVLAYLALREVRTGALTTGVIHGDLAAEMYPTTPIQPCQTVQATVTVVNPTVSSKTYTLLGEITDAQGNVVAHWWPDNAVGASASTAYHGLTVTVPPFGTAQVTAATSPWSLPGTFGTTWTLQWNGQTLTTRQTATAFQTAFASAPTQCGAPA